MDGVIQDLIRETTATTGAGLTLTLSADAEYGRFADVTGGVGTVVYYALRSGTSTEFGLGTVQAANTFDRTTPLITIVSGVYDNTSPVKITLAGTSSISIPPSATALNDILSDVANTKQTIYIPATAMVARTTAGALASTTETTTNKVMISTMDFSTAVDNYVQFVVQMPKSWNASTVTAQFNWSHAATTVNFGVRFFIQGVALVDGDALDTAFGTGVGHTADTGGVTDDIYITAETSAVTIANTPAKSDFVVFQVYRDVSDAGDTLAIDARLHGVSLFYTTDAATDA